MRVPREQISTALFTLLQSATWQVNSVNQTWATADPRLSIPDNMPPDAQPALFLVKPKEKIEQETWGAPQYLIQYYALILVRSDGTPSDFPAEQILDRILDAIETVMAPSNPHSGGLQTLGGLVNNAWISGDAFIDSPVLLQQASCWLPISVIVGL